MRKLTFLLAVAALAASNTGCVGRCRNWFHKGSPCGTVMSTPAVLSAPIAMGAPMAGPVMQPNMCCEAAPVCVDPCMQYDPCATGGSTGAYFGGYMPGGADCGCAGGAPMGSATMAPSTVVSPMPVN
ncbi:MAG TPA: hypothetical protein VEQ85_04245 [Lacipirellulaceae bacterium]|nr:hypothetical protein [Lacipirellulaceae bacterium]